MAPTISVGIPVYNGELWITQAIESILAQTLRSLELIITDNASNDGTEAICRAAAARDPRIRYLRNDHNIGIYANVDLAFKLAQGEYFKWAACSDFCLNTHLEKCIAVLQARPDVVLVYPRSSLLCKAPDGSDYQVEYDDGLNLEDESPCARFSRYLEHERMCNVVYGVIRASALRQTGLNRPMPRSDISMIAELSLLGKFVEVPDRLFVRRHDAQTSSVLMNRVTAMARATPGAPTIAQRTQLHIFRFASALRAPIRVSEKLAVVLFLFRQLMATNFRLVRSKLHRYLPR